MSRLDELNRKIDALEQELVVNKAKVDAGTLSEAREIAIRQQIASDNNVLASLMSRRERLEQQQQQAGE